MKPKKLEFVVSLEIHDEYAKEVLIPTALVDYIKEAVQGWCGQYEADNPMLTIEPEHLRVRTLNQFMMNKWKERTNPLKHRQTNAIIQMQQGE